MADSTYLRKPEWLKIPVRKGDKMHFVEDLLKQTSLHTVCQEANCPNRMECFSKKTATFMILGRICSRGCRFCNVTGGKPTPVDQEEPKKVAEAIKALGLKFAVITSVTRDDLEDGGSAIFAELIREVHRLDPPVGVEVLITRFSGSPGRSSESGGSEARDYQSQCGNRSGPLLRSPSGSRVQPLPGAPFPGEGNGPLHQNQIGYDAWSWGN